MKPSTKQKNVFIKRILATQIAACAMTASVAFAADDSSAQTSAGQDSLTQNPTSETAPEFKYLDANDDREIDWSELHAAYGEELAQLAWNEQQVISRFDNNQNEKLSSAEYGQFTQALAQEMTDAALAADDVAGTGANRSDGAANTPESATMGTAQSSRQAGASSANGETVTDADMAPRGAEADSRSGAESSVAGSAPEASEYEIEDVQLSDNYLDNSDVEYMEEQEQRGLAASNSEPGVQPSTMQTTAGTQAMPGTDSNVNDLQADVERDRSAGDGASIDQRVVATPDEGGVNKPDTRSSAETSPTDSAAMTRNSAAAPPAADQAMAADGDRAGQAEPVVTTTIVAVFPDQEIPVSEIEDREVVNAEGEAIGEVEEVIISGEGVVTGIVVGIGGFLDIGDKDVFVNIADVTLSREQVVWRTNMNEDALKNLPEYKRESISAL